MYSAIVCPLTNVRKHSGADRLQLANAQNYQIITGLDTKEGDLGVLFTEDGALSPEMIYHNNLSSITELNKEPDKKPGFFGRTGRVKAQRLRGEKSFGFWTELSALAWTGADLSKLKEGDTFTDLNGHHICHKYISQATLRAANRSRPAQIFANRVKKKYAALKEHFDTPQLKKGISNIPVESTLYLTSKCHGTSGRTGNVLTHRYLLEVPDLGYARFLWLNKLLSLLPNCVSRRAKNLAKRILFYVQLAVIWFVEKINKLYPLEPEYKLVTGTRKVVLDPNATAENGFYLGKTFRIDIHKRFAKLNIPRGQSYYYEIAGYDESGTALMPGHTASQLEDKKLQKEFRKLYGETMNFSYGCNPAAEPDKRYRIFVYRITETSDGKTTDLSWPRVKEICADYGLETVPDLVGPIVYDGNQQALIDLTETFLDQPEAIDPSHIREGVCVRAEYKDGMTIQKNKSFLFLLLEHAGKSNPDVVDVEEAETLVGEEQGI